MPTIEWLKKEFNYGYDSGNILSFFPNSQRRKEEERIGGSYKQVFKKAILPYIQSDSNVLELGPGKGSWSRAILTRLPKGTLHTLDFQNVSIWLKPDRYSGRLTCHKITNNSYPMLEDKSFDFFWSMGVLCHNNLSDIEEILTNSRPKMKSGAYAVHQYSDWEKLDNYGWQKGAIPTDFKNKPDEEIWWPRNNKNAMKVAAENAGWQVINNDLDLLGRDSIILLQNP
ncbi:MAG: methyltransferase domain-containing protein [Cyanobacteria bacterium P01_D01_bin.156]